jgi:outer membrane protein assembly factor BamB
MCAAALLAGTGFGGEEPAKPEKPASADWPCWRGPDHNGAVKSGAWRPKWENKPPKLVWTKDVGVGYSGLSIVGDKAYTMGHAGKNDLVWCLDTASGKELWKHEYADLDGPRATPAVADGVVYTASRTGKVLALKADSGQQVWAADLGKDPGLRPHRHGFSGSPLVDGNRLILNMGASGTALDRATGKVLWTSGKEAAGFSTPVPFSLGDRRGVMLFTARSMAAVDVATGKQWWSVPWTTNDDQNIPDPSIVGDRAFITSGYGVGGSVIRFTAEGTKQVWKNQAINALWISCVVHKGYIYGFSNVSHSSTCSLKCLDFETGKEMWAVPGHFSGSLILVDDKLVVMAERGELMVIEATHEAYRVINKEYVFRSATPRGGFATPISFSRGLLYARTDNGSAYCIDMR